MKRLFVGCAIAALATSSAYAQSTGAVDFEEKTIVVTGARGAGGVAGVVAPQTAKTKAVLTQEFIQHTNPGQTINDVINMLPGVSFQNNDPFGSAGGTLNIRGFDASRIVQTFDGIPLNDTGNYAIYSNQQLDPELIEQVNVNLGTTDVDSPSAGASGSTVNYRTVNPEKDFHVRLEGSAGEFSFFRIFAKIDTGEFTPWGTRAFFAASRATNDAVWGNRAQIGKQQYNVKVYQPIGSSGDFVSVAGHYNRNRNGFFGSMPLRFDTVQSPTNPAPRVAGSLSTNRFGFNSDDGNYTTARCTIVPAGPGAQTSNTCGTSFDERYNPSNTGNIRINSRFTLADGLVLTVDPSYQYVLANGGGTIYANEGRFTSTALGANRLVGFVAAPGTNPGTSLTSPIYAGVDLNGDGDVLDTVTLLAPSTTNTHRYGVIASLRYDISPDHTVRVGYTLDYGKHRQTGEAGLLQGNGVPYALFPKTSPLLDGTGRVLQKRDRLSYAILNQASAEYTGHFFDRITLTAGVRAPWMTRKLNNRCATTSVSGTVDCFGDNFTALGQYLAAYPYAVTAAGTPSGAAPPQRRQLKYNKVLPNVGFVVKATSALSAHFNYSKGLQVPGTDNLYNSFYFPVGSSQAKPKAETTDNFDLGVRYTTGKVQAELTGWYTRFENRLAQAYDPLVDRSVYTNLGRVDRYGVDASISYRPIKYISLYAFGSYLKSKIKDNVAAGGVGFDCSNTAQATFASNCFVTKGKRESFAPVYTIGGRVQGNFQELTVGIDAKRTGRRYLNDQNLPVTLCTGTLSSSGNVCTGGIPYQVAGAFAKGYTLVNFDARYNLGKLVGNDRTWVQLNVYNMFNKFFVGGFGGASGQTAANSILFVQQGAPRAITGTLNVGF